MKEEGLKLMDKYMKIAQPDKPSTTPHPKTIKTGTYWQERRGLNPYPDVTRTAYYWMAMGISELLKTFNKQTMRQQLKEIDFEDYLQEKHSEQYVGLDDDMPDDFNDWLNSLDPQEMIDFGQKYAEKVNTRAIRGFTEGRRCYSCGELHDNKLSNTCIKCMEEE